MKNVYGNVDGDNILNVYPRPQMKRKSFINLNGYWDYAITSEEGIPDVYDGRILVPFSPESKLSGVGKIIKNNQVLWYHRELKLEKEITEGHLLLHFGAIDQEAWVYVNGFSVAHHLGGYLGFTVDITEYISADNDIYVKVKDLREKGECSIGGQLSDKSCFSGIWQTVWLEEVPEHYIRSVQITPIFDECAVELMVMSDNNYLCTAKVMDKEITFEANRRTIISLDSVIEWTPQYPYLYTVIIEMNEDRIETYFGMRKISVEQDNNGIQRIYLNNRPFFFNGICDEGYYGDSGYTAMSDRAMIYDIYSAKKMGFNMIRKHLKIEPMRWYYHCDRMGMLAWQDILTGICSWERKSLSDTGEQRTDEKYIKKKYYEYELEGMVKALYNCVSIVAWIAPEQKYGKFDSATALRSLMAKDKTRLLNFSSYNKSNVSGDVKCVLSSNILGVGGIRINDKYKRAVVVMDAGKYECRINKEYAQEINKKMTAKYRELYSKKIWNAYKQGLSGVIFNYLSDNKEHFCGILTEDRKISKFNRSVIRMINKNYNG